MGCMKFNIMNIIAAVGTVIAIIGAIFAADARYIKVDDLQLMKTEIINEMRREVTKNRAVMIAGMQRDADDLEFIMMEHEQEGSKTPRYIIEKHKQIERQIEDLRAVDKKDKE